MIELSKIDINRVQQVRAGERYERGCGKTTEKLLDLFSYALPQYDGMRLLFVGENHPHTRDIYKCFWYWLKEANIQHTQPNNGHTIHAIFNPKKLKNRNSVVDKAISWFDESTPQSVVSFRFVTPRSVSCRGIPYDKIIIDLTTETRWKNHRFIQLLRAKEKKW